jgi:hypothetical protein
LSIVKEKLLWAYILSFVGIRGVEAVAIATATACNCMKTAGRPIPRIGGPIIRFYAKKFILKIFLSSPF